MRDNAALPLVLLTRPLPASRTVAEGLSGRAEVHVSPLIGIVPTGAVVDTGGCRGVITTSVNGVEALAKAAPVPMHVVGAETARAARARGWTVGTVARDADDLVGRLIAAGAAGPLLHVRGEHSRGDISQRLCSAGIETDFVVVYRQDLYPLSPAARDILGGERAVIVPLYSPRTAGQFAAQVPPGARVHAICLSAAVRDALGQGNWEHVETVASPDGVAMLNAIHARIAAVASLEGHTPAD